MPRYTASETQEYMPKQGHPARRSRQRTVCLVSWKLTNAYIWYFVTNFVHRKLHLTTVPVVGIEVFFQLLLYLSAWCMKYDFLMLSVPSSLQGKWNCSYRSVACNGGSRWKTLREKLSGKKTKKARFLKRYSLTTSIATLAWGTYLLGLLPAWLNQQPHVYTAI